MTTKDYKAIASIISQARELARVTYKEYTPKLHKHFPEDVAKIGALEMNATIAENLANMMAHDNSNFNRELFLAACGIEDPQPNPQEEE